MMIDEARRCTAKSKQTHERCKRAAVPGKRVCYYHGGASTGPKTPEGKARCAMNAVKHGLYAKRVLDEEEQRQVDAIVAQIREDFALNESSDAISVTALAMAFLRLAQAVKADNPAAAESWDRIVRNNLKDLKATKIAREGEGQEIKTTPAEWATALLEEARAARKGRKKTKAGKRKATDADRTQEKPQI